MHSTRTAALISLLLLTCGCDHLDLFDNTEESATRACEEQLKEHLTSPSSYRRIWSSFTPAGPPTKEDLIEAAEAKRLEAARSGNDADAFINAFTVRCLKNPGDQECADLKGAFDEQLKTQTAFVLIQFESANAFNAVLPRYFNCRLYADEGRRPTKSNIIHGSSLPKPVGDKLKAMSESISR